MSVEPSNRPAIGGRVVKVGVRVAEKVVHTNRVSPDRTARADANLAKLEVSSRASVVTNGNSNLARLNPIRRRHRPSRRKRPVDSSAG